MSTLIALALAIAPARAADADADGFLDGADNCPTVAQLDQADADGDGSGDACAHPSASFAGPGPFGGEYLGAKASVGANNPVGADSTLGRRVTVGQDGSIGTGVSVGRASQIGDRVAIGDGATLGYAALVASDGGVGAGAIVGNLAELRGGASIGQGGRLGRGAIVDVTDLGSGVQVGPSATVTGGSVANDVKIRRGADLVGASVGAGATIGREADIGAGAQIGAGAVLRANVTVMPNAVVDGNDTVPRGAIVEASTQGLALVGSHREWADGTLAASCWAYKNPDGVAYAYTGQIGTGLYRIDPTGGDPADALVVHCDMTWKDGGWTRIYRHTSPNHWAADTFEYNRANPLATDRYGIFNDLEGLRRDGRFEFAMFWPGSAWTAPHHWTQTSNPVTTAAGAAPTGCAGVDISYTVNGWGCLQRSYNTAHSLLDGTINPQANWYYSVGTTYCWGDTGPCYPAPDGGANSIELWVR